MLHLFTDYHSETHWRWELRDERQNFLAAHTVALDAADPQCQAFVDVPRALQHHVPEGWDDTFAAHLARRKAWLHTLGEWAGVQLWGDLRSKLLEHLQPPATVVQVVLPQAAQALLRYPFELAHIDGQPLATLGLRLVYVLEDQATNRVRPRRRAKTQRQTPALRVLGIFSQPDDTSPLNLHAERYQLKKQLETLAQTKNTNIYVHTVQYGATKAQLKKILKDGQGWDLIHFSGHGLAGELLLEKEDGKQDRVAASELLSWLRTMEAAPRLVTLSVSYASAANLWALRAKPQFAPADDLPQGATDLPTLAQAVAQGMGCAVLAMRYAVGDEFALALWRSLFENLLEHTRALPDALQLALNDALDSVPDAPETSALMPLLFGARATTLQLQLPARTLDFKLPTTGLLAFGPEPEQFVGRLRPMLHASQALATNSGQLGVLFYGMAGAGKTACALELAHRHDRERFTGYVWYTAPSEGQTIDRAFYSFLDAMEVQLMLEDQTLTRHAHQPEEFEHRTVPQFKDLLRRQAILVVIDNVESLLTPNDGWRDAKWGTLIEAVLLAHTGLSRIVLTSRRLPAPLVHHPHLQKVTVHALSLPESVLFARQLPHLRRLADTAATSDLWLRALAVAQGHPYLLKLINKLAENPAVLRSRLEDAQRQTQPTPAPTPAFLQRGETDFTPADFLATLTHWTEVIVANLPPTAKLLFYFLARCETEDLISEVIRGAWHAFLQRLSQPLGAAPQTSAERPEAWVAAAQRALAEPEAGLAEALTALITVGLIEARPLAPRQANAYALAEFSKALTALLTAGLPSALPTAHFPAAGANSPPPSSLYQFHPAIAEIARTFAPTPTLVAADWELGNYWKTMYQYGLANEMQGASQWVVEGGKRAVPYLQRTQRREDISVLLDAVLLRDTTPTTLALALPALQEIAAQEQNPNTKHIAESALANALMGAGHYDEAEQMERARLERCLAQDDYQLATVALSHLLASLRAQGQAEQALSLTKQLADYTQRAGLGPWAQLHSQVQRLQLLNALERYAEVLAEVERLRPQLNTLPEQSNLPETTASWNVRELLLEAGREAALHTEQWALALTFNADNLRYQKARQATIEKITRTQFNDHLPLLRLGRYAEASQVLAACREVYEQSQDAQQLVQVFHALAALEASTGQAKQVVYFAQTALRYAYQANTPADCAASHHHLALYLKRQNQSTALVLAHLLAACMISWQKDSGAWLDQMRELQGEIKNQRISQPTFAAVVQQVEQIAGVRFGALFAQLPQWAQQGGEAAVAKIWELAKEDKTISADGEPQLKAAPTTPKLSFGEQLRALRVRGRDPQNGRTLTQIRLAELLGNVSGLNISGATVSYWETGRNHFPGAPRQSLLGLLQILHKHSALTPQESDALLIAGDHRDLNVEEQAFVFGSASRHQSQINAANDQIGTTPPIFIPRNANPQTIVVGKNYFFIRIHCAQAAFLGTPWHNAPRMAVVSKVALNRMFTDPMWAFQHTCSIPRKQVVPLGVNHLIIDLVPATMEQVAVTFDFLLDTQNLLNKPLVNIINDGGLRIPLSLASASVTATSVLSKLSQQLVDSVFPNNDNVLALRFLAQFNLLGAGLPEGYYVLLGSSDPHHPLPPAEDWSNLEVRDRQLLLRGEPVTELSYIVLEVRAVAARTRDLGQGAVWELKLREAESQAQNLANNPLATKAERQQGWELCLKLLHEARNLLQADPAYLRAEADNIIKSVYDYCLRQLETNIRNSPMK